MQQGDSVIRIHLSILSQILFLRFFFISSSSHSAVRVFTDEEGEDFTSERSPRVQLWLQEAQQLLKAS